MDSIATGADFETYGYSDVLPLYLWGVMGNIVSTADTLANHFKHVITMGDALPYFTFWGRIGDEYTKTDGCKIDQLEMSFEGNKPLTFGTVSYTHLLFLPRYEIGDWGGGHAKNIVKMSRYLTCPLRFF